jgi:ribose 5-phosphate isomerase B
MKKISLLLKRLKGPMIMAETICVASDHAGFELKEKVKSWLTEEGYQIRDFGTSGSESVDYPDFIHPLAEAVSRGEYITGIIMCGTGNGVSMTANKYPGIRAALCWKGEIAQMARLHNDANILAMPARYVSDEEAKEMLRLFLHTPFEGGRHLIRIEKINRKQA